MTAIPIKILIVEDEMLIAANMSLQLTGLGYEVTGIVPRGEEALLRVKEHKPDIVLLDINLKGSLDGIETAVLMQQEQSLPIIYLTANTDEVHFNRAKETNPYAFISKPYKKLDLQRAIELTINQISKENQIVEPPLSLEEHPFIFNDSIFVRHNEKMIKVLITDILYIEAQRNYSRIYTKGKEYLLVMTLKQLDEKLPGKYFLRVHRSFIVNISQIEEIAHSHLVISNKAVPMNKPMREEILKRVQAI